MELTHSTKQRLLDAGIAMLLEHGYHDLGIQALLEATRTPKGSFYHHFEDKEDFALQVIDQYMGNVHAGLDACLGDSSRPPLERVRRFFETVQQSDRREGAALRSRLRGNPAPLTAMLDFYFHSAVDHRPVI